jgi:hypothetical protein
VPSVAISRQTLNVRGPPRPECGTSHVEIQDHSIDSNKAPGNLHIMEYFEKIFLW